MLEMSELPRQLIFKIDQEQRETDRREANAALEPVLADQLSVHVFDSFAHVNKLDAWGRDAPRMEDGDDQKQDPYNVQTNERLHKNTCCRWCAYLA